MSKYRARFVAREDRDKYPTHPFVLVIEQLTWKGWKQVGVGGAHTLEKVEKHGQRWLDEAVDNYLANLSRRKAEEQEQLRREAAALRMRGPVVDIREASDEA